MSKIDIDLCLSDNTIGKNKGAYKGFTTPIKEVLKINFNFSSNWLKDKYFVRKNSGISNMCWTLYSVNVTS